MIAPHLLSDYCAIAILAVDPQQEVIVAANPACESLLGYPLSTLLGLPISQIEVGLQDVFFWEDVRQCGLQEVTRVEGEYRHAQGHLFSVSKTIRLVDSGDGPVCIISVQDISASKKLEEESDKTSALLAATLESTVDGILVTNLDGVIQHYNHRLLQVWPIEQRLPDLFAQPLSEFKQQLPDARRFDDWLRLLYHDPFVSEQQTFALRDGRVYEITSCPQQYRDAPIGRLFCLHDISALKAIEAQLREARDQAQQANQAKSDFLAHMSHELRTPLNAMMGFAQVIENDSGNEHQVLGGYIHQAGRHLLELINEVLDLASIEAGKLKLKLEPVNLPTCIQECLNLTQLLARDNQVTLSAAELPAATVLADERRLRQMLLNLISNAIKYNRQGGRVDIQVERAGEHGWRINVRDTGLGIAEEDQAQLFTTFNRVGSHLDRIEGTGIGLAFTRKLAQLMQGQVGVSSQLDVGSTFWIELPGAEPFKAQASIITAPADDRSRTLLYIEDDLLSQKLLQNVLLKQRPQYHVYVAKTGQDGIAMAKQLKPDLILLDQQLPDGTGQSIYTQLQNHASTRDIPCVALSGNTLPEQINDALASGFVAYLSKPLQISQALLTIDDVLACYGRESRKD
ncbi:PAS domain-containing hybrid sensor histidine kinase/response regulator [Chitinibacter tainanensis]|uniref:PAS domain-containing hybrid sensor histidine kinase/response regulator n=1 Tax=Chitinibacter tainanensis TaxID=230667 RepID=UPI00040C0404|nr:PAS domain-containing hybrid sensor histidine kinase/response regulator [Chitinibacter tainanensis]